MPATTFAQILKFNPYHDSRGRFASASSAASFTWSPGKSKAHDNAIQRAKETAESSSAPAREYKSFEDPDELNAYFGGTGGLLQRRQSVEGQWVSSLSREERDAISSYAADGYSDINSYWRKYGDYQKINKARVEEQTKHIDEAISRFEIKDNITTYRSIKSEAFGGKDADLSKLVGSVYNDDGFMSTSPVKSSKALNKDLMLEINIPAGKGRAAYINKMAGQYQNSEYELLVARGSKFNITGYSVKDGIPTIQMEMICND